MEARLALHLPRQVTHSHVYPRLLILLLLASLLLSMPRTTPAAPLPPTSSGTAKPGPAVAKPPAAKNAPNPCTPQAGPPPLLSPGNGSVTNSNNAPPLGVPNLQWGVASNAVYYHLQVSTDPGFAGAYTIDTYSTNHTPTGVNFDVSFPNGVPIYWRVQSFDANNCASAPSSAFTFQRNWNDAPALVSPADGVSLTFLEHPSFSWMPVAGANNYLLRISNDSSCLASIYRQVTTSEVEFSIEQRLPPATYYWCVSPLDFSGREGHLSAIRSFHMNDLDSPTLLSPGSGAQLTFTPPLSWTAVKGAARYRLLYSTSPDFSGATVIDTSYTSYTPQVMLPNSTHWYWKVATIDPNGRVGPFSTVLTFRLNWQIQPQLLTPNNLYFHVTYPYFQWTGVPDAREYQLQIALDSGFSNVIVDVRTSATSYIIGPATFVPDGQTFYYWRVTPYGSNPSIQGFPSSTFSFKYDAVAAAGASTVPSLFYPPYAYNSDPRIDRPITSSVAAPIFQWQRVTSATNYIVTFGSTINMTDTLLQANTTQPNFSPNLADNGGNGFNFDPSTIYYWRVQYQVGANTSPTASQVWAVRVNPALDYTYPYNNSGWLQSPTDLQDYVNMDPVFRWYPYSGANRYSLQVATDAGFSNIMQTVSTAFAGTALRQQLPRNLYYWRVLAYNGNNLISTSTTNRLHIFGPVPYINQTDIRNIAGSTVATGTVAANPYDLSALYATKTNDPAGAYKLGLSISSQTGTVVNYTIPINLDYSLVDVNGQPTSPSGAPNDPLLTNIHYAGEFQAEYVVKFTHNANGTWTNPQLYAWLQNGSGGQYDSTVIDIVSAGGAFTPTAGYVEMSIPTGSVLTYRGNADLNVPTGDPTLLGMEAYTTDASGTLKDTVPDDPGATGGTPTLSQFRSISDHPNLAYPFNTDYGGNGQGVPYALSVLYNSSLAWYMPEPTDMHGFDMETAIDRGFTSGDIAYNLRLLNGLPAFQFMFGGIAGGLNGGRTFLPTYSAGTYYWRVRMCRDNAVPCNIRGSWSKPNRFNKVNIKVDPPTANVNYGVPTFTWPRTEGAFQYEINIHLNPQYGNLYDDFIGENPSYTPLTDYQGQDYYYRLRADEFYYAQMDQALWTTVTQPFHVTIPQPPNLHTTDASPMVHSPTFAWDAVLFPGTNPLIQAYQYQLQTSTGTNFNQPIEDINTVNLNWTPFSASYRGGTYFFRIRTVLHDNAAVSDWTTPITFTKQYPLVNAGDGDAVRTGNCSLTFTWPAFNTTGNPVQPSGILGYVLETADNPNFSNERIIVTNNASYTNYNDVGGCTFSPYQTTYWRVSMLDTYNNQGPADVHTILGQTTPTVTGTPPTSTPTWTPGGPTATGTPTWTPSGPTNTPTNTPTSFSATNTPTPTFTPGGPTATPCAAMPFSDVRAGDWDYNYILYVYCHGVVNGVGGGLFAPNATATRAQFSRMVVKARGLTIVTPASQSFTDVPPSYFAYSYIETAKLAGIVSGYTQAQCAAVNAAFPCFLPNSPVTRGAMAKFVVKAWGWPQTTPPSGQTFTDVPPSYTFYIFIETAAGRNIVNGGTAPQCLAEGRTFPCYLPNDNLTRGQLSKTLFRAMTYP